MALLFVFGSPGVGKSYVGRILQDAYQFYCYEADDDLTDEMIEAIHCQRVFTEKMRADFFSAVITKTASLSNIHNNIVVTQALIKEANRNQIAAALPETQFIHVTADDNNTNTRLKLRGDWVSVEYSNKIRAIFEKPRLPHFEIDNNQDKQHITKQLDRFFRRERENT